LTEQEQPLFPKIASDLIVNLETDTSDNAIEEETELTFGSFSLWLKFSKNIADFKDETLKKWKTNGLPSHSKLTADRFTRKIILGRFSKTRITVPLKPLLDPDFD